MKKIVLFLIMLTAVVCSAIELRQSTVVDVMIGPFVDATDGITREDGLTINAADIALSKNGAAFSAKNDADDPCHSTVGWYIVTLNATDTGTLGVLVLDVLDNDANAVAVWKEYMVVTANVWDSKYSTDVLQVAADPNIALILADTGELQTNQGNWVTATGFATATELAETDANLALAMGATFATGTDSLEAIRNRGDAAWTGSGEIDIGAIADEVVLHMDINSMLPERVWEDPNAGNASVTAADRALIAEAVVVDIDANSTQLAAIVADTGTTLPASIAAVPTVDEIWAKAMSDLAANAPSATASVHAAINWLYEA